jgi:hypothetical protein
VKRRPLLQLLHAIIERSYAMPRVIEDPAPYLIGDEGYRVLYGDAAGPAATDLRARLLVRKEASGLRAALYYPDELVRHLERHDPRAGIGDQNIDAFATLVEELDHLLVVAGRAADARPVTLLELEFHAAVTKYLLVVHFIGRLTGRLRLSEFHRLWARHHLFEKYAQGEGEEETRYLEAARLAGRYVRLIDSLTVAARRAELHAFHRRSFAEQVRRIAATG